MDAGERRRARYANMTPEDRERRRSYQRKWMARHRAELREQAKGQTAVKAPASPVQPSAQAPESVGPSTPQNAPQVKPAQSGKPTEKEISPQTAKKLHRAWRADVRDEILDFLTSGQCSLTGRDYESNRSFGLWFGIFDRLTQIENVADNDDQVSEIRLAIAIEAIRRLSGESPAGSAPALPARTAL
jgi:hypothetical protein